jgi:hypothetical protein
MSSIRLITNEHILRFTTHRRWPPAVRRGRRTVRPAVGTSPTLRSGRRKMVNFYHPIPCVKKFSTQIYRQIVFACFQYGTYEIVFELPTFKLGFGGSIQQPFAETVRMNVLQVSSFACAMRTRVYGQTRKPPTSVWPRTGEC